MLAVIKTDGNQDVVIENGKFVLIYAAAAASQVIADTMRVQLGSYKYDQTKGIQYFDNIFLGNPNFQKFESQARAQVNALPFVKKIKNFTYNLSDSTLSYTMTVETIYGTSTVSE